MLSPVGCVYAKPTRVRYAKPTPGETAQVYANSRSQRHAAKPPHDCSGSSGVWHERGGPTLLDCHFALVLPELAGSNIPKPGTRLKH